MASYWELNIISNNPGKYRELTQQRDRPWERDSQYRQVSTKQHKAEKQQYEQGVADRK